MFYFQKYQNNQKTQTSPHHILLSLSTHSLYIVLLIVFLNSPNLNLSQLASIKSTSLLNFVVFFLKALNTQTPPSIFILINILHTCLYLHNVSHTFTKIYILNTPYYSYHILLCIEVYLPKSCFEYTTLYGLSAGKSTLP